MTVFYNPKKPKQAYVEKVIYMPGTILGIIFVSIGGSLLLAGVALYLVGM